jgi:hypothetical protein
MQVFIGSNVADSGYHHAVLNPTGQANPDTYKNVAGFDFIADSYTQITWPTAK